ncbi:hypothetical protein [Angustibacter luteus]|uniref:Uncharacterized protein n=1 Tax=Angustibacter luteus TaxID=658456 RepID=A0ABW1JC42_9ACTN
MTPSEEPTPGPRRRRRATRPATGGPASESAGEQTKDDTDAGWGEAPDRDEKRDQHEQWLHEQRPPHWE